ncbi:MAG: DUF1292 domain-containing protein [Bacillota bacterium]
MDENKDGSYWYDTDNKELVLIEDDKEYRFYLLDKFNFEGNEYCVLSSSEEESADDTLLMKIIEEDDQDTLAVIEDDSEFEKVSKYYYYDYEE